VTAPDAFAAHADDRGRLIAVEFDELSHAVRRVFVVTGLAGGADRGDHDARCAETVVLLAGTAVFWTTAAATGAVVETCLDRPGQRLDLGRGDHIRYRLTDEHSQILVLAEEPYQEPGQ